MTVAQSLPSVGALVLDTRVVAESERMSDVRMGVMNGVNDVKHWIDHRVVDP